MSKETDNLGDETLQIVEACLLTAPHPISLEQLSNIFDKQIPSKDLEEIINLVKQKYKNSKLELLHLNGGYRFRSRQELQPYLHKLYQIKPPRYLRATMEILAIIVYSQPITRGEIENIRGVAINSNALSTLFDRGWIESIGHKAVPGSPELLATTAKFLEDFAISGLEQLPPLPIENISNNKIDIIEEFELSKGKTND